MMNQVFDRADFLSLLDHLLLHQHICHLFVFKIIISITCEFETNSCSSSWSWFSCNSSCVFVLSVPKSHFILVHQNSSTSSFLVCHKTGKNKVPLLLCQVKQDQLPDHPRFFCFLLGENEKRRNERKYP